MPALEIDWIGQPQEIIQQVYGNFVFFVYFWLLISSLLLTTFSDKHNGSNTWETELQDYFVSRLSNHEVWTSIPSLNEVPVKDINHGQLVRFRGKIQHNFRVRQSFSIK